MVSFPAGIVQVVANNPNPAQLSFKIRNASVFESIVPNLKLVTPSELLSTPDGKVFEFKMDALRELLKVQSEMNPNAAYFNIDLLKYQVRYFSANLNHVYLYVQGVQTLSDKSNFAAILRKIDQKPKVRIFS